MVNNRKKFGWLLLALLNTQFAIAQAPDWMFALEGSYVGRYEVPDEAGLIAVDARWDGKRSGKEDGFVLQISREYAEGIEKEAQMWNWNADQNLLDLTTIADGRRLSTEWFCTTEGLATTMTRGGNVDGKAAIIRVRLERLPGQLRVQEHCNFGDGTWQLQWRYVLDDFFED